MEEDQKPPEVETGQRYNRELQPRYPTQGSTHHAEAAEEREDQRNECNHRESDLKSQPQIEMVDLVKARDLIDV